MADATDSKSVARKGVWVRLPPPVLLPVAGLRSSQVFTAGFDHSGWLVGHEAP